MKGYQLSVLCASVLLGNVLALPQVPYYTSKYPQHPQNQAGGTGDYEKYWLGQQYAPGQYGVAPGGQQYDAPQGGQWGGQYAPQPAQPDYYYYPSGQRPQYEPPRYFPNSRHPAKDAIEANTGSLIDSLDDISTQTADALAAQEAESDGYKGEEEYEDADAEEEDADEGNYSHKDRTQSKEGEEKDGSDWNAFSFDVVSDTVVHHDPYEDKPEAFRKTHALDTVNKMLGKDLYDDGYEDGEEDPLYNRLARRSADPEEGWPEHIQAKAQRMMDSASSMQDRGQVLVDSDTAAQEQREAAEAEQAAAQEQQDAREASPAYTMPAYGATKNLPRLPKAPGSGRLHPEGEQDTTPTRDEIIPAKKHAAELAAYRETAVPEPAQDPDMVPPRSHHGRGPKSPRRPRKYRHSDETEEVQATAEAEDGKPARHAKQQKPRRFQGNSPWQGRSGRGKSAGRGKMIRKGPMEMINNEEPTYDLEKRGIQKLEDDFLANHPDIEDGRHGGKNRGISQSPAGKHRHGDERATKTKNWGNTASEEIPSEARLTNGLPGNGRVRPQGSSYLSSGVRKTVDNSKDGSIPCPIHGQVESNDEPKDGSKDDSNSEGLEKRQCGLCRTPGSNSSGSSSSGSSSSGSSTYGSGSSDSASSGSSPSGSSKSSGKSESDEDEKDSKNHLHKRQETIRTTIRGGPPVTIRKVLGADGSVATSSAIINGHVVEAAGRNSVAQVGVEEVAAPAPTPAPYIVEVDSYPAFDQAQAFAIPEAPAPYIVEATYPAAAPPAFKAPDRADVVAEANNFYNNQIRRVPGHIFQIPDGQIQGRPGPLPGSEQPIALPAPPPYNAQPPPPPFNAQPPSPPFNAQPPFPPFNAQPPFPPFNAQPPPPPFNAQPPSQVIAQPPPIQQIITSIITRVVTTTEGLQNQYPITQVINIPVTHYVNQPYAVTEIEYETLRESYAVPTPVFITEIHTEQVPYTVKEYRKPVTETIATPVYTTIATPVYTTIHEQVTVSTEIPVPQYTTVHEVEKISVYPTPSATPVTHFEDVTSQFQTQAGVRYVTKYVDNLSDIEITHTRYTRPARQTTTRTELAPTTIYDVTQVPVPTTLVEVKKEYEPVIKAEGCCLDGDEDCCGSTSSGNIRYGTGSFSAGYPRTPEELEAFFRQAYPEEFDDE